ncbi:nucleotide sugar dehydrogenase, partial [Thioclava sp. BHET1]
EVAFHDPHSEEIPRTREYMAFEGRRSVPFTEDEIRSFDAVVIATDHDAVDYARLIDWAPLVIDTRNIMAKLALSGPTVVKA